MIICYLQKYEINSDIRKDTQLDRRQTEPNHMFLQLLLLYAVYAVVQRCQYTCSGIDSRYGNFICRATYWTYKPTLHVSSCLVNVVSGTGTVVAFFTSLFYSVKQSCAVILLCVVFSCRPIADDRRNRHKKLDQQTPSSVKHKRRYKKTTRN